MFLLPAGEEVEVSSRSACVRASMSLVLALSSFAQQPSFELRSPDGKLAITIRTVDLNGQPSIPGQLAYEVTYQGKTVIARSRLGLELRGQPPLGERIQIESAQRATRDETYQVVHGKANPVRDHCNEATLRLVEPAPPGRQLLLELRAYDDAVAFRYVVPGQPAAKLFELIREHTEFQIPRDCVGYPLLLPSFQTNYEDSYRRLALSRIPEQGLIGLPFVIDLAGVGWVAITEAQLEDYAGMYLRRRAGRTGFVVDLPPHPQEPGLRVFARTPHRSPWRVVLVAEEPGRLIESNTILNLNPPSRIADTSWIRPGKAAWNWWFGRVQTSQGFETAMDTRTMKYLIDFAAESGLEYVLIDAGWSDRLNITRPVPAIDIEEIVRYGRSKNVGIWLWVAWTGVDAHMDEAFPLYEKWGIRGIKVDYMDRDDQWMVNWYHRVIEKAAQHKLMVDFHGAYKPTGIRRTWPNLMTREGVLGQEYSRWSAAVEPEHNVTLAFTRLLAGPMDFTPGGFRNATRAQFEARRDNPMVLGTRAHNIALLVVYESPFLVLCDHPDAYRNQPGFEFVRRVPASWDETRVVAAQPMDYVVIARRRGREWFVGGINDWTPRQVEIPLEFLGSGDYQAELYVDAPDAGENPTHLEMRQLTVDRAMRLRLWLAPGGGCALHLRPVR